MEGDSESGGKLPLGCQFGIAAVCGAILLYFGVVAGIIWDEAEFQPMHRASYLIKRASANYYAKHHRLPRTRAEFIEGLEGRESHIREHDFDITLIQPEPIAKYRVRYRAIFIPRTVTATIDVATLARADRGYRFKVDYQPKIGYAGSLSER